MLGLAAWLTGAHPCDAVSHLCRPCKGEDVAVPLLLLCCPHALQRQGLCNCLTCTTHAARRVYTQQNGAPAGYTSHANTIAPDGTTRQCSHQFPCDVSNGYCSAQPHGFANAGMNVCAVAADEGPELR